MVRQRLLSVEAVQSQEIVRRERPERLLTEPLEIPHEDGILDCAVQCQPHLVCRSARETWQRFTLPDRSFEHQVHALARTLDQATLRQRFGQAAIRSGEPDVALMMLKEGIRLAEKEGDDRRLGRLRALLAVSASLVIAGGFAFALVASS